MATILFGWPLVSDTATLSGGSWTLPLTNLQTAALGTVARSTNDANSSTIINADYGSAKAISVVALVRHNLRSAATWRVRGSAASDMSAPVYDSGTVSVWPVQWPTNTLPTGHPNAATRLLTDAQIDALNPKRDAVMVFTEATARYWRIEIFDDTNADTYVQIGRLVMAPRFQPSVNLAPGSEFGIDDGTTVGRSLSRVRVYGVVPRGRTLTASLVNVATTEAVSVVRDMLTDLGQDGQVYVVTDPADTTMLQRRSFLANPRQLSAVQYQAAGYDTIPLAFDEVL